MCLSLGYWGGLQGLFQLSQDCTAGGELVYTLQIVPLNVSLDSELELGWIC